MIRKLPTLVFRPASAVSILALATVLASCGSGETTPPPVGSKPAQAGAEAARTPHVPTASATAPTATTSQPDYYSVPFKPLPVVEKRGTGPINLVLIPDQTCDWSAFEAFMSRNADRYTMYAVTLPGFGDTEPPQAPLDAVMGPWLDNAVKAVWTMVQEKNITNPVIVGHKMGGHMSLRLGIEHGAEVRAVVSIDGWPAMPLGIANLTVPNRKENVLRFWTVYKMMSEEAWQTTVGEQFGMNVTDSSRAKALAAVASKTPRDVTLQYTADLFAADLTEQLPALKVPALVVASVPTRDLQAKQIKEFHESWTTALQQGPTIKLVFFEKSRTFIQEDRPLELDAAIADFLAGREVKGVNDDAPPGVPDSPPPALTP